MPFTIDKKVPIRNPGKSPGRPSRYRETIEKLQPGDSFFIPKVRTTSIAGVMSRWKFVLGIELATRAENGGVRVWRVK